MAFTAMNWSARRLHDVGDITDGEDASAIRSGSAPEVLAAVRSAHLELLRQAGWRNIAAAIDTTPGLLARSFAFWDSPLPDY